MPLSTIREQGPVTHWPVLSVSILSYNQKSLLSRAIESVLDQRTNFACEIIIGDDCSGDGSQEVLRDYEARYPHLIFGIYHPRRYENEVPGRTNNITNLSNCRGEFTAMLDGDDFYTDPDKLQRQVDLLRANTSLSFSCHETEIEWTDDHKPLSKKYKLYSKYLYPPDHEGVYDLEFLTSLAYAHFHVSSIVFRTAFLHPFPQWFRKVLAADRAIFYLLCSRGGYHYAKWVGSVRHQGEQNFTGNSYWNGIAGLKLKLRDIEIFGEHFPSSLQQPSLAEKIGLLHLRIAEQYQKGGAMKKAVPEYLKAAKYLRKEITWDRLKGKYFSKS